MGSSANWIALVVEGQIVEVGQIVSFKEGQSKLLQLEPIASSHIKYKLDAMQITIIIITIIISKWEQLLLTPHPLRAAICLRLKATAS